jgi:hypothetical protein
MKMNSFSEVVGVDVAKGKLDVAFGEGQTVTMHDADKCT